MRKTIFITGAGAGIGAETARLFVRNGWHVGAADISADRLVSLETELGASNVSTFVVDVREYAAVEAAVKEYAEPRGGRLDAVFANAGVLFMGPDETITLAQKNLLVDVNVKGVIHTVDAALPFLKRTPGAHVVAMSSTSAEYGAPHLAVYSATKFFVRGYTEALNIEYAQYGINVSAIYVAYVQTGMVLDAPVKAASVDTLGVKIRPHQVAERVWSAVHGEKSHWRVGLDAKALNVATRLLGAWVAPIAKKVTRL
jgi:NADP-dependent 3-hydroxy acid dehydrogenase YdfG